MPPTRITAVLVLTCAFGCSRSGSDQNKQVVRADGITISVLTDGRIAVHSTSQWNEPLDQTFANCDYYRNAIPVLERQLVPERAELLGKVCRAK